MEGYLNLFSPEKIVENRLVTGSMKPNQISEIDGKKILWIIVISEYDFISSPIRLTKER